MIDLEALVRVVDARIKTLSLPVFRMGKTAPTDASKVVFPNEDPLPFSPTFLCRPAPNQGVLTVKLANQLYVLGAVGNGAPVYEPTGANLDTYRIDGVYVFDDTAVNGPVAGKYGVVFVTAQPNGNALQRMQLTTAPFTTWTRRWQQVGASWSSWRCLDPELYEAVVQRTTAGPSVPASTWTRVAGFDTTDYNDGNMVNLSSGDVTIPVSGRYQITLSVPWRNYASVYRRLLQLNKNSTNAVTNTLSRLEIATSGRLYAQVSWRGSLAAGDIVRAWLFSDTSSSGPEIVDAIPTTLEVIQTR